MMNRSRPVQITIALSTICISCVYQIAFGQAKTASEILKPAQVVTSQVQTEFESDRKAVPVTHGNVLIKNGRVMTVTHGTLESTDVLIQHGKITAIGKAIQTPPETLVIDASGRFVTPGLIDAHSHRAEEDTNEGASSITAEVRIYDTFNPRQPGVYEGLASGITTALALHGSANAIGGQSLVHKNKWDRPYEEAIFAGAPRMIKFALGENVKRPGQGSADNYARFPSTRVGVEAVYRRAFADAKSYIATWDAYHKLSDSEKRKTPPPRRDLRIETLAEILQGKIWVQCHSYRQSEMLMMARLSQQFGFHLVLQHALEAYKIAPELAAAGVPVSMFGDAFAYKYEVYDSIPQAVALSVLAGVITSVNTDTFSGVAPLSQDAGRAVKYGLSEDQAMRLITINPAIQLGVEGRVGSLEVGKDGDVAIWQGHPLSVYSKCATTIVEGEVFFQRRDAFKVDSQSISASGVHAAPYRTAFSTPVLATSYLLTDATVHPVSGPPLNHASVLIVGSKILAVSATQIQAPRGTVIVQTKGLDVYPGFIDAGSTLGLQEIGQTPATYDSVENGDFKPDLNPLRGIDPDSVHIPKVRANGVTTVVVRGDGGLISGQGTLINTSGFNAEQMVVLKSSGLYVNMPEAVSGNFALFAPKDVVEKRNKGVKERTQKIRDFFAQAKKYVSQDQDTFGDLKLQALRPYLKGELPVIFNASGATAIRQALSIGKEFNLRMIIAGAGESWKLASLLSERKIPVILDAPSVSCPGSVEATGTYAPYDSAFAVAAVLRRAGVKIAFQSGVADTAMDLPFQVGRFCAFGLDHDAAIKGLTLDAATILGVGSQLGSLEPGKTANVIVTDGDPLELTTNVCYAFINGKPVSLKTRFTDLYDKYGARILQIKKK